MAQEMHEFREADKNLIRRLTSATYEEPTLTIIDHLTGKYYSKYDLEKDKAPSVLKIHPEDWHTAILDKRMMQHQSTQSEALMFIGCKVDIDTSVDVGEYYFE